MPDAYWTDLPRITVSSISDTICAKRFRATRLEKTAWADRGPMPIIVPRSSAWLDALHMIHLYRSDDHVLPSQRDQDMFVRQAVMRARYERGVDRLVEIEIVGQMVRLLLDNQDPEDVAAIWGLEEPAEFDRSYAVEPILNVN